jgi:hypothetical protein
MPINYGIQSPNIYGQGYGYWLSKKLFFSKKILI